MYTTILERYYDVRVLLFSVCSDTTLKVGLDFFYSVIDYDVG